jgi:hypothetical protein
LVSQQFAVNFLLHSTERSFTLCCTIVFHWVLEEFGACGLLSLHIILGTIVFFLAFLCIRCCFCVAFHWRAITLVAASPMSVRCQSGTFTPFPTQLVLHSENHTLDSGDGRLDRRRIVRDRSWLLERQNAVRNDEKHVGPNWAR